MRSILFHSGLLQRINVKERFLAYYAIDLVTLARLGAHGAASSLRWTRYGTKDSVTARMAMCHSVAFLWLCSNFDRLYLDVSGSTKFKIVIILDVFEG